MTTVLETLENNYILFDSYTICVVIDTNDKLWFNAKQITRAIGYKDPKDALNTHVNKKHKERN
jgi:prophage antirepressor-like protein